MRVPGVRRVEALTRLDMRVLVNRVHVVPGIIVVCESGVATLKSARDWPPALVSPLVSSALVRGFEPFVAVVARVGFDGGVSSLHVVFPDFDRMVPLGARRALLAEIWFLAGVLPHVLVSDERFQKPLAAEDTHRCQRAVHPLVLRLQFRLQTIRAHTSRIAHGAAVRGCQQDE